MYHGLGKMCSYFTHTVLDMLHQTEKPFSSLYSLSVLFASILDSSHSHQRETRCWGTDEEIHQLSICPTQVWRQEYPTLLQAASNHIQFCVPHINKLVHLEFVDQSILLYLDIATNTHT